jgi:hypothetical protein
LRKTSYSIALSRARHSASLRQISNPQAVAEAGPVRASTLAPRRKMRRSIIKASLSGRGAPPPGRIFA